jgi:hypothetical protein
MAQSINQFETDLKNLEKETSKLNELNKITNGRFKDLLTYNLAQINAFRYFLGYYEELI